MNDFVRPPESPRKKNAQMVKRVVRVIANREGRQPTDEDYSIVGGAANRMCGIRKVDDLTTDETLAKRLAILTEMLRRAYEGETLLWVEY